MECHNTEMSTVLCCHLRTSCLMGNLSKFGQGIDGHFPLHVVTFYTSDKLRTWMWSLIRHWKDEKNVSERNEIKCKTRLRGCERIEM